MAYHDILYLHNEVDGLTVRLSAFKFKLVVDYLSKWWILLSKDLSHLRPLPHKEITHLLTLKIS